MARTADTINPTASRFVPLSSVNLSLRNADIWPLCSHWQSVGHASILADEVDTSNAVYFDEDCFLRGTEGRFVLDTLPPIAGNAVAMGRAIGERLVATKLTLEEVLRRIKFA